MPEGFKCTVVLSLPHGCVQYAAKSGKLSVGLDAAEASLGFQQAGGGPWSAISPLRHRFILRLTSRTVSRAFSMNSTCLKNREFFAIEQGIQHTPGRAACSADSVMPNPISLPYPFAGSALRVVADHSRPGSLSGSLLGSDALSMIAGRVHTAPISRAWRRSILALPYICRFTNFSLVIWPSV